MSLDRFYHGDGGDQLGQVNQLLNGNNRYKVLWDGDKIGSGFGILSGINKDSIKKIINMPTLSGRKRITGRQLLSKAKASIKEAKVLLAYWTDYTRNGGFPSGKNEEDALEFCKESVTAEHQHNMEKEDDTDDDEEEDEPPVSQSRVLTQPLKNRRVVESDTEEPEAEDEGSDDEDNEKEFVSKRIYNPPALVTFMLLGPYGCEAYGFPVSAVFSIDTESIEENAKTGMYNTKSMKEEKKAAADLVR